MIRFDSNRRSDARLCVLLYVDVLCLKQIFLYPSMDSKTVGDMLRACTLLPINYRYIYIQRILLLLSVK